MEGLEEGGANHYENGAHNQRSENAPKQHPVVICSRHRKVRKDQDEYENVINAERVLDEVTRKELQSFLRSEFDIDPDTEHGGQAHPGNTPQERFPHSHGVRLAMKDAQINDQKEENNE